MGGQQEVAKKKIEESELIFLVFDYSRFEDCEDKQILEETKGKNVIGIINVKDLLLCDEKEAFSRRFSFCGNREDIRNQAIENALQIILEKN